MKTFKFLLLALLLIAIGKLMGQTSYVKLGTGINGSINDDALGFPVTSSSDGSIIAVGAIGSGNLPGYVKVLELSGSNWIQKGSTLNGQNNGDGFGRGLSISGNGLVLAIGASHNKSNFTEFSNSGRVYIYEWNGSAWIGKDTLNAKAEQEAFGDNLSLSVNGDILAIGAPGANGGGVSRGVARVYKRNGSTWTQIGSDINGVQNFETFGNAVSIAITATDSVLAVGAPLNSLVGGADDYAGKVHIYRSSIGKWGGNWTATDSIKGSIHDYFGYSLHLSANGSELVVGAPQDFLNPGTAYAQVYKYTSSWATLGSAISSSVIGDELGKSVALSGDGTHLIIGVPTYVDVTNSKGYAKLFKLESSSWILQDSLAGAASEDAFGASVAINNNGLKLVVGATGNDSGGTNAGQVQVFKPFEPDAIKPTVTLSTTEKKYTRANPFSITITFSEQVSDFIEGDITVVNGSASNLASTNNIVFTASITPLTNGAVNIDVAAGVAADLANNSNEAAVQLTINYDGSGPSVVLVSQSGASTNKSPFVVQTAFGEKVNGFVKEDIIVSNGSVTGFTNTDNSTFLISITPTSEGAVKIDVPAGTFQDSLGNNNTSAPQLTVNYDITKPTVVIATAEDTTNVNQIPVSITFSEKVSGFALQDIIVSNGSATTLTTADSITFTVNITTNTEGINKVNIAADAVTDKAGNGNTAATELSINYDITRPEVYLDDHIKSINSINPFLIKILVSEKVKGFELGDFLLTNASASNLQFVGPFFGTSVLYSVNITPTSAGDITINLPAGVLQDIAGNNNTAAIQVTIKYDLASPTVVISSTATNPSNSNLLSVTITFNEKVSGFELDDIKVGNGFASTPNTSDSIVFTAEIITSATGTLTIDIAAGVVHDLAGNNNTTASQFSISIDKTLPTLQIASTINSPTNNAIIPITITFSEAVNDFIIDDFKVVNGVANNLTSINKTSFTADITPSVDGNVSIDVAAGVANDFAGNGNTLATQLVLVSDRTAPKAVIQSELTTTNGSEFMVYIGFGEKVTELKLEDILVVNGTPSKLSPTTDGYFLAVTPNGNGNVTVDVPANITKDLAGNSNLAAIQLVIAIDLTAPVVTLNKLTTNDNTPVLTGTIDDNTATVTVEIASIAYTAKNNGDNTWTLIEGSIQTAIADGSYDVTVTAKDVANNIGKITSTGGLIIDATQPTVTLPGAPTEAFKDPFSISIKFSENVSEFLIGSITVENGTASNFASTAANNYAATITPATNLKYGDIITINIAANAVKDVFGNGNPAAQTKIKYIYKYSGGRGLENDPYLIANEADLRSINVYPEDLSSFFKQIADIEIGTDAFTPIGNSDKKFRGVYNGQGKNINGLNKLNILIINGYNSAALFGDIEKAKIHDLNLTSIRFSQNDIFYLGGLVVRATESSIEQCSVTGSITTNKDYIFIGGLISLSYSSKVTGCFTDIDIRDNNAYAIGGLIGSSHGTDKIYNCYSVSNLTIFNPSQTDNMHNIYGGLVGELSNGTLSIDKSYYAGVINTKTIDIGGLVAKIISGSVNVTNSFWDKDLSGVDKTTGGGTGKTTDEMKNFATYNTAKWDFTNETTNGTSDIWQYAFTYPLFKWQVDRMQNFTISGKVVDENGNIYNSGIIKAYKDFAESGSAVLDAEGKFSLNLAKGSHLLVVMPNNTDIYFSTYYGNTNNGFKSKIASYNNSGVVIQMIAKSQENLLNGQGKVSGKVVKTGSKKAAIVQGKILDGEPIAGVTVFLVRVSDEQIMTSVVTDENGDFEITGIPEGEYQLMLDVVGIDANLAGSTFTMDEQGTPMVISAAIGEEGVVFTVDEETVGLDKTNQVEVSVYPNPANKFVNIQLSGKAVLRVLSLSGALVKETSFVDAIQLDVEFLLQGIYMLEIRTENGVALRRIIKK